MCTTTLSSSSIQVDSIWSHVLRCPVGAIAVVAETRATFSTSVREQRCGDKRITPRTDPKDHQLVEVQAEAEGRRRYPDRIVSHLVEHTGLQRDLRVLGGNRGPQAIPRRGP